MRDQTVTARKPGSIKKVKFSPKASQVYQKNSDSRTYMSQMEQHIPEKENGESYVLSHPLETFPMVQKTTPVIESKSKLEKVDSGKPTPAFVRSGDDELLTPDVLRSLSKTDTTKSHGYLDSKAPLPSKHLELEPPMHQEGVVNILELLTRKDNLEKLALCAQERATASSTMISASVSLAKFSNTMYSSPSPAPLPTKTLPISTPSRQNSVSSKQATSPRKQFSPPRSGSPPSPDSSPRNVSPTQQRWAGHAFCNSPPPNSLPFPSFAVSSQTPVMVIH